MWWSYYELAHRISTTTFLDWIPPFNLFILVYFSLSTTPQPDSTKRDLDCQWRSIFQLEVSQYDISTLPKNAASPVPQTHLNGPIATPYVEDKANKSS